MVENNNIEPNPFRTKKISMKDIRLRFRTKDDVVKFLLNKGK